MAENKQANASADFFKNFGNLSMPSVDFNELFNVGRRNMEAYSAANQVLVESAQAINKRSAEVAQNNVEKYLSASREAMTGGSPEAATQKQSEITKDAFESYANSVREISEMASKSAFEAFDMLNKRCAEAMEETSKLAKKAA